MGLQDKWFRLFVLYFLTFKNNFMKNSDLWMLFLCIVLFLVLSNMMYDTGQHNGKKIKSKTFIIPEMQIHVNDQGVSDTTYIYYRK